MYVSVGATGYLKDMIKGPLKLEVDEGTSLQDLKGLCGIPDNLICGFTCNGRVAQGSDSLGPGDEIVFLMIVGAG